MPGYDAPVIMAKQVLLCQTHQLNLVQMDLQATMPVYFQGGLTWHHAKLGILKAFQNMVDDGLITLK